MEKAPLRPTVFRQYKAYELFGTKNCGLFCYYYYYFSNCKHQTHHITFRYSFPFFINGSIVVLWSAYETVVLKGYLISHYPHEYINQSVSEWVDFIVTFLEFTSLETRTPNLQTSSTTNIPSAHYYHYSQVECKERVPEKKGSFCASDLLNLNAYLI